MKVIPNGIKDWSQERIEHAVPQMEVARAQSRHVVTCKLNFALIFVSLILLLPLPSPSYSPIRTISGTKLVIFYSCSSKLCELSIGSYCAASSTLDNVLDIPNLALRNSSQFPPSFLCGFPCARYLLRGTLTWTGSCVDNMDTGLGECLKDNRHR